MKKAQNILIAGFGDIGKRVAEKLRNSRHYRIKALVRKTNVLSRQPKNARFHGVQLLRGDLSNFRSLQKLTGFADTVLHFAPPPSTGKSDTHTQNLLAALGGKQRSPHRRFHHDSHRSTRARPRMLPRRIIYISTTGVYGNCNGEWIDETRPVKPQSERAYRRVDAERRLRKWGRLHSVSITILRAPGIYAKDRLPLDRLLRLTPALIPEDDVFTNHIHASDLTSAVMKAVEQRRSKQFRVFNVVDDSQLRMGDYFDQVADAFGLTRPPRISRLAAEREITPMLFSFMRESRRIGNARAKRELKIVLQYPTLASVLRGVQLSAKTLLN